MDSALDKVADALVRDAAPVFVMLKPKPLPGGNQTRPLRARVVRELADGRLEIKIVASGLYEGGYEIVDPRDLVR